MMSDGLLPGGGPQGLVRVPGSKSIAQRALAAATFARGTTTFSGLPSSEDVVDALRAARAVGARFPSESRPDDLFVTALMRRRGQGSLAGSPPVEAAAALPWCRVPVGESGTTARFYSALLALARPPGSGAEVIPRGTLVGRRSGPLFRALAAAGAGVEHAQDGAEGWPVLLTATCAPGTLHLVEPSSSQEVSALLCALSAHGRARCLEVEGPLPSADYVELTVHVLRRFGATIEVQSLPWGRRYRVAGPLRAPSGVLAIEPDASAAAVALAAGCLGGQSVWVEGLGQGSMQPDLGCIELLRAFGVPCPS